MIQKEIKKKLMGTAFTLGIIAKSDKEADFWLKKGVAEIQRIEVLLSEYLPNSLTSKINESQSNQPVKLNKEVVNLINRCKDISQLTSGCFDLTTSKLKKLYSFKNNETILPDEQQIKKALASVGYKNLKLDIENLTIQKLKADMSISFNAVGKGYAADMVKKMWQNNGIESGFINASGDLCAFGYKLDNKRWNVAIANPDNISKPLMYIPMYNQAIATSGDSEQYFMYDGQKFSHNINPLTGKPLQGIKSVSIISPSAELSDALATAVYVMGEKKGIAFVNQLPQTFAVIINKNNSISLSKNLKYETFSHL